MARVDMPAWATKTTQDAAKTVIDDTNTRVRAIETSVAALAAKYSSIVVTCETRDDVTVTGQIVTLRAGSSASADIYDTRPYNGQPVTFEVPRDFRYFIEVTPTLPGHFSPTTATGTATTGTVAVTLTYSDIDHVSTFADIQGVVASIQSQAEGRVALVGVVIDDTWTDDDGITVYDDPMVCVDVQPVKDPQGAEHLAAIMMRRYCTKYSIPFDAPEYGAAAYATEETAIGGHYYWGYGATYSESKTYAVNAFCSHNGGIYKCTTAVTTAGAFDESYWQLLDAAYYLDTKTYAVGDFVRVGTVAYQCTAAVETPEEFDETKWEQALASSSYQAGALVYYTRSTGQTIDYTAYAAICHTDVSSGNKDYFQYGYNNYEFSAQRQYLESSAAAGEWWHPTHVGDCPPGAAYLAHRGYQAGCSAELLAAAKPVQVPIWPWNLSAKTVVAKLWLPSGTEMYGAVNENEGYALKWVEDACVAAQPSWTSARNDNNAGRVFRWVSAKTTAAEVRLRSAYRGTSYNAWVVIASGSIYGGNGTGYASNALAALPACAIY